MVLIFDYVALMACGQDVSLCVNVSAYVVLDI